MPYKIGLVKYNEKSKSNEEDYVDLLAQAEAEELDADLNKNKTDNDLQYPEYSFFLNSKIDEENNKSFHTERTEDGKSSIFNPKIELEESIRIEFAGKLSQFKEYLKKGYNSATPDQKFASNQEEIIQISASLKDNSLQAKLSREARKFLDLISPDDSRSHKKIYYFNHLIKMVTTALTALNATAKISGDWENGTEDVISQQLNRLSGEAAKRIAETAALPAGDKNYLHLKQQLEVLLFSQSHDHEAENIKFSRLRHSLLAEDRITRTRLVTYLDNISEQTLLWVKDARQYAIQERYARHLSTYLSVCEILKEVAATLRQQAAELRPEEEKSSEIYKDPVDKFVTCIKRTPKKISKLNKEIHFVSGIAGNQVRKLSGVVYPSGSSYSEGFKRTITDTALLLLDELHQIKRRIKLLPAFARELQEAVEQRQKVMMLTTLRPSQPVLNELLDEELKKEETRWAKRAQLAQENLTALIAPVVRFKQEKWKEDFNYGLAEVLSSQKPEKKGEWEERAQFRQVINDVVRKFAVVANEIDDSAVSLANHGHVGGEELKNKSEQWLKRLNVLEGRVSAGVAKITGAPLDYFSRGGMLARGIAEWAQELKQAYLSDQYAEAALFDEALMNVLEEKRDHFRKKSDPEAAGLLRRVKIELKNAAQNTIVYPLTPEEILAGARTVREDIRLWAEKKVVNGAISAAITKGFKIFSSPLSLPGRLVITGAKSGLAIYQGTKAINCGVKFGQESASWVKNKLIRQELSKAAFRMTVSISPLVSWGVATSITVKRLCNKDKYGKNFITKSLTNLPGDQERKFSGKRILNPKPFILMRTVNGPNPGKTTSSFTSEERDRWQRIQQGKQKNQCRAGNSYWTKT